MFLEQLVNGISVGIIYALVAVGYSLVFGVLHIINLCHGVIYTFGAFMVYIGIVQLELNPILAILISCVLTGMLGLLVDRIGLKPLRDKGSDWTAAMISSIGCSYIITNCLQIAFGSQLIRFPVLLDFGSFQLFGATITSQQIMIAIVAIVLLILLTLVIRGTRVGLAMRSVCQSETAAAINGINVNNIITFTFFLGAASAAIAGALNASYYEYIRPSMGNMMGLKAFSAAVLGGIGSLTGSVIGGVCIGVIEAVAVYFLGGTYQDLVAFFILFLVLLIRPYGILGKKESTKV